MVHSNKISVITSTFNNEKTITDTINSILNQTYSNIEFILIDGDSKDETVNIIKSYENEFIDKGRIYRWISEPDNGIYDAWNKGLKMSTGDWFVFIGADDYLKDPFVYENIIPDLISAKEKNINFVYGKIEHINFNGIITEISGKPWLTQKKRFTYSMNVGYGGSFLNKSLFEVNGNFNELFKIAGDYEFLLREFKNPEKDALFVDKILLVMREGGVSANLENRIKVLRESQKARKINGLTSFSRELMFWEVRILIITLLSRLFGNSFAAKVADIYRNVLGKDKRWSD